MSSESRAVPEAAADLVRSYVFASVRGCQSPAKFFIELENLNGKGLLVFFQQTQGFPDDFASGVVTARLNLAVDELSPVRG
jgi:hypothetical protein